MNEFVHEMEEHIAAATRCRRLVVIFMVMMNKDMILLWSEFYQRRHLQSSCSEQQRGE